MLMDIIIKFVYTYLLKINIDIITLISIYINVYIY